VVGADDAGGEHEDRHPVEIMPTPRPAMMLVAAPVSDCCDASDRAVPVPV
jgi:hypothetical protein